MAVIRPTGVYLLDFFCSGIQFHLVCSAASDVGLLTTDIVLAVAIGIQAGAIVCSLLGKLIGLRLQAKAKKHDQIYVLDEVKPYSVADHMSIALNDDKISDDVFRLIIS